MTVECGWVIILFNVCVRIWVKIHFVFSFFFLILFVNIFFASPFKFFSTCINVNKVLFFKTKIRLIALSNCLVSK